MKLCARWVKDTGDGHWFVADLGMVEDDHEFVLGPDEQHLEVEYVVLRSRTAAAVPASSD